MADSGRQAKRRRARRRRVMVVALAVAVMAGGAGTAWAMTGSSGPVYRLATVERADVEQTVDADGILTARDRATLSFPTSGTVASVPVAVGDHVSAGQVVARLDPTALEAAVTSAKQQVAQARQRLAADEDAQASGTASTASTSSGTRGTDSVQAVRLTSARPPSPTTNAHPRPGSSRSPSSPSGNQTIQAAQHAVEEAQRALDEDLRKLDEDLHTVQHHCVAAGARTPPSTVSASGDRSSGGAGPGSPAASPGSKPSPSSTPSGDIGTGSATEPDASACRSALAAATTDQSLIKTAGQTLSSAVAALSQVVSRLASSSGSGASTRASAPARSAPSSSGTGTGTRAGTPVTAEQIAADTKGVDAAQAALAVAQHDVGYATLTTPISGTVGSLSIEPGDAVSASSTSATVVVVGAGALSTQVDIGLSEIDLVKVGQAVQVTVDGRSTPLPATVTYVGAENASSSTGSSATYPVTVTLRSADTALFDGMGASVAIDVGAARGPLTVPVSAVHTAGQLHTVDTYADGKATTQRVTLGVQGEERVQVLSGLSAGDRVVLADVGAAVPSSTSNTGGRNSLTRLTGGGGFGGLGGGGGFVRRGGG